MDEKVRKRKFRWKKWIPIFIMMSPGLIYLFINNYIPIFGLVIAFKKVDFRVGIMNSPWAGLSNFTYQDTGCFYYYTKHTAVQFGIHCN